MGLANTRAISCQLAWRCEVGQEKLRNTMKPGYSSSDDFRIGLSIVVVIFTIMVALHSPRAVFSAEIQKLEKLVIGYPAPVASLGIIEVMRKAGLFKKNGLDVDLAYIQGSPILTTAMVSGQVPLSFIGGAAIVASAVGGADTV